MNMHSPNTAPQDKPCDVNRVELTGAIVMPPELMADPYGRLIVSALVSSRSQFQMALLGTYDQQLYLFNVIALGGVGEQLASMRRGTVISIHGSLDYAYNPWAKSSDNQWTQAVRAERIEVLHVPSPE